MNQPPPQSPQNDALYERFVPLFVAHEARLRGLLRTLLPRWDAVDDVLQETSLVAWRKFAQFDPGTNFMAWVGTIARFEALRYLRDQGRDPHVFSDELFELMATEAAAEADALERERTALGRCLQKLPATQREFLELAYQPGAQFNELALQAGRSVEGVYKSIQRMRSRLLECIQRELKEEPL